MALWTGPELERLKRGQRILLNINTRSGLLQFWGETSQLSEHFSGKGVEITLYHTNMQSHDAESPPTGDCGELLKLAKPEQLKFLRCWSSSNWAEAEFTAVDYSPLSHAQKGASIKGSI